MHYCSSRFRSEDIHVPGRKPLIKIPVQTDKWNVENSDDVMTISPKSDLSGNFFCMIWTSANPSSETVIDDLSSEATNLASSLLSDLVWGEEITDFESNEISFVGMDGKGYFVSEDGAETPFMTSVMLLMPDDVSCIALVFFSATELYNNYESDFLDLILSITPAK